MLCECTSHMVTRSNYSQPMNVLENYFNGKYFRARSEAQSIVTNVTSLVDQRCSDLVNEGSRLCSQVMGQINTRFSDLTNEVTIEVRKQCDTTKQVLLKSFKIAN